MELTTPLDELNMSVMAYEKGIEDVRRIKPRVVKLRRLLIKQ